MFLGRFVGWQKYSYCVKSTVTVLESFETRLFSSPDCGKKLLFRQELLTCYLIVIDWHVREKSLKTNIV